MLIYKTALPVERFHQLSKGEKAILIILSNAYNEIVTLHKLAVWVLNFEGLSDDSFDKIEKLGRVCQAEVIYRILIGKLHEVSRFMEKNEELKPFFTELPKEIITTMRRVRKEFHGNSDLGKIRNKMATHYEIDFVADCLSELEDEDLFFVVPETVDRANALFFFAEATFSKRQSKLADVNLHCGLESIHNKTALTAKETMKVIDSLLHVIFEKKLEGCTLDQHKIETKAAPNWRDVTIPFFTETE